MLGGRSYVPGRAADNYQDASGHGTHVAGIAGAATNNGRDIAGAGYQTRLAIVQVLDGSGRGDTATIAQATIDAVNARPPGWRLIFNYSLGCECFSQALSDALDYAAGKGVVIVAAAGNSARNIDVYPFFPATHKAAITVASVGRTEVLSGWSNYGTRVNVTAPGEDILSLWLGGTTYSLNGTSMATPLVSGIVSLLWAAHPDWTPAQLRDRLEATARKPLGYSRLKYGAGIVDALAALAGSAPAPTPAPPPPPPVPTATPRPVPTPTAAPSPARQVFDLINAYRASLGLAPFTWDARLAAASDYHNQWMHDAGCWAHQCAGEPDPWQRMRNYGYPLAAGSETIGRGYPTPQDMLRGWQQSPPHNAILTGRAADAGCAFLSGTGGPWWTCDYGTQARAGQAETLDPLPGGVSARLR